MKWLTRLLTLLAFLSVFLTAAFFGLGPQWVDRASNRVVGDPGRIPTLDTLALHKELIVGDLHADSALWGKDLLGQNNHGQVDFGVVNVTIFTSDQGGSGAVVSLSKGLLLSALTFTSASNTANVASGTANSKSLANGSGTAKVAVSELSIGFFTKALENIATLRATNAAGMARLQLAEDHARLTKANLEAANSRIMDVDVAEESTRFAKFNILSQASAAMLSQANQSSATALMLL